ncbi:hypothetical protein [Actinoplanes sp. NPDC051851]|uniref:hypothetical protein n=1 Tax=Actinoplanes sp. NPDC051851 TaxID=3154753 RepID=UPI003412C01B
MDSPVVSDAPSSPDGDPAQPVPPWPKIADYWPDAPQRFGPQADHYELPGAEAVRTGNGLNAIPPARGEQATAPFGDSDGRTVKNRKPVVALFAATILAAGAILGALQYIRADRAEPVSAPGSTADPAQVEVPTENPPVSIGTSPPSAAASAAPPAASPTATAIPDAAVFEFADGVTDLNVTIGDVPNDGFFQVTTGQDSKISASTTVDGDTLKVGVVPNGRKTGSAELNVILSSEVDWAVRMRGGVRTGTFDLSHGTVSRIDLIGGANTINIGLPRQDDGITIRMTGGVNTWRIETERKTPVRALFRQGAGTVTLYGDKTNGVDKGETLRSGDGDGGIELEAVKGVGTLTVSTQ